MASTSSTFSSLASSSAHFIGSKVHTGISCAVPARVQFPPLRVSAAAACASTAERPQPRIASPASLYEVLGIQMGASGQEIKAAYRRLARVLHPDVAAHGQNDDTAQEFIRVHEAYTTLFDPEKRADYDRMLMFKKRCRMGSSYAMSASVSSMASSSASGFSGCTRRTWETDQCW